MEEEKTWGPQGTRGFRSKALWLLELGMVVGSDSSQRSYHAPPEGPSPQSSYFQNAPQTATLQSLPSAPNHRLYSFLSPGFSPSSSFLLLSTTNSPTIPHPPSTCWYVIFIPRYWTLRESWPAEEMPGPQQVQVMLLHSRLQDPLHHSDSDPEAPLTKPP